MSRLGEYIVVGPDGKGKEVKHELIFSTMKKGCEIWVERDPESTNIYGLVRPTYKKAGRERPQPRRTLLGKGDSDFAKSLVKDFVRNVSRGLTKRRPAGPLTR